MPYGLFGLLYEGTAGVGVFNSTVASSGDYNSSALTQSTSLMVVIAMGAITLTSIFA
jgi:hypothetical protein